MSDGTCSAVVALSPADFTVCTTATCRPELLDATYRSLFEATQDFDWREVPLNINIDPLPRDGSADAVHAVAKTWFASVCVNKPETPNFATAVKWLWSTANTPYILHLEDDWLFVRSVWMADVMKIFADSAQCYQVRFSKGGRSASSLLGLSPSIIRHLAYKPLGEHLLSATNPEVQVHQAAGRLIPGKKGVAVVYGKRPIVVDVGRAWLANRRLARPTTKSEFTSWRHV